MKNKTLYVITDPSYKKIPLEKQVLAALKGGAKIVQLRDKYASDEELIEIAKKLLVLTKECNAKLIINDNVAVAKESGADGVHLGQGDMNPVLARKLLGENAIIGVTAKTVEQAIAAKESKADYLGSGAMFLSPTKKDAIPMTKKTLCDICSSVDIPVYAIGGITLENANTLANTGISGIAVVSAVFEGESEEEIEERAVKLFKICEVL